MIRTFGRIATRTEIAQDGSKYANPTDVVQIAKIERFMEMLIRLWSRSRLAIN